VSARARLLGGLSARAFLARHWQKRPLLVRGALPGFRDPITPYALLQLACRDDVESRLVRVRGGRRPFELGFGPQDERRLARLPAADWTLLVDGVDRHVRGVARLLRRFAFIPSWRIDDVMVSLAVRGGTVGPHVDNYDVFLIQGRGRRRWQVERRPERGLRRGLDLQVLRRFEPEATWVLEPGDMLYVPPGVAHYGIALEDCLTYSVGFRAPSHRALVAAFAERLLASIPDDRLYADPELRPSRSARGIDAQALARMQTIVRDEVRRGLRLDLRRELLRLVSGRRRR
jgi:50S ribosomal protein L16 3-hydroxylase